MKSPKKCNSFSSQLSPKQKKTNKKKDTENSSFSQSNTQINPLELIHHRNLNLQKKGILRVACYAQFYPVCFLTKDETLSGIDVDIICMFANEMGLSIEWILVDNFQDIWNLDQQTDVAIGGIANSIGRGDPEKIEWSLPYFYVRRSFLYNKKNPISKFPEDVTDTVLGTVGSTGWLDAKNRATKIGKEKFMQPGSTDEDDVKKLLNGEIQGLMRGDFVSRAWVRKYPKQLGYISWDILPELVKDDGEVFAYPTRVGSGLATLLSSFLVFLFTNPQGRKIFKSLLKEYNLK